jgi:hypothetical protein
MKQAFLTRKPSRFFLTVVVLGLLFGLAWPVNAADSYDLADDFSITNGNPNDDWAYGTYTSVLGGPASFALFVSNEIVTGPPLAGTGILEIWRDFTDPNIIKNVGDTDTCCGGPITFNADQVTFGPTGGPAVARWTAPSSGCYQVDATFATVQPNINGIPTAYVFDGTDIVGLGSVPAIDPGPPVAYSQQLWLSEDDTIDFVVAPSNGGTKTTEVSAVITKVSCIDIKPGSDPNSINPRSKGKIPVAILSTMYFDAPVEVDTESLTFGPTGDEDSLAFCNSSPEDVNDDGRDDLVCHFYTQETGFECGDGEGILRGQTMDEVSIEEIDFVRIVPSACKDQEESNKGKKK